MDNDNFGKRSSERECKDWTIYTVVKSVRKWDDTLDSAWHSRELAEKRAMVLRDEGRPCVVNACYYQYILYQDWKGLRHQYTTDLLPIPT